MASPTVPSLSWSLCIATLNRVEALEECIALALRQTRPPVEVIVVDASENWDANRATIAEQTTVAGVSLKYLKAPRRSITAQRNAGISKASGDVLFLIDDDSFMYLDCAAEVMRVYEADAEKRISVIGAASTYIHPEREAKQAPMKDTFGVRHRVRIRALVKSSAVARFFLREILLLTADRQFVPYDPKGSRQNDVTFVDAEMLGLEQVNHIFGFTMTVRREVALVEPFDDGLEGYCVFEDMDATYRFGRHGFVVIAPKAKLFHAQVQAGRDRIETIKTLEVANLAYFVRLKSTKFWFHFLLFWVYFVRRCFAELLKDLLVGRLALGRFRATLRGFPLCVRILFFPKGALPGWYSNVQKKVMARG